MSSVLQIGVRDLFETTRRVESRGEFICECRIVDKAVCIRRPDGLFVEMFGIQFPPFQASDFCAHQRGAVLEIFRTVRCPDLELAIVGGQSLEMIEALVRQCAITQRCPTEAAVEFIFRRLKKGRRGPEQRSSL